jgi:hypothetical protein
MVPFDAAMRSMSPINTPLPVITGLVPVIPIMRNAALHRIGMAGTRPAMTVRSHVAEPSSSVAHMHQHMPLLAGRQLQGSIGKVRRADLGIRVLHDMPVKPCPAAEDEAARLALGA